MGVRARRPYGAQRVPGVTAPTHPTHSVFRIANRGSTHRVRPRLGDSDTAVRHDSVCSTPLVRRQAGPAMTDLTGVLFETRGSPPNSAICLRGDSAPEHPRGVEPTRSRPFDAASSNRRFPGRRFGPAARRSSAVFKCLPHRSLARGAKTSSSLDNPLVAAGGPALITPRPAAVPGQKGASPGLPPRKKGQGLVG